VTDEAVEYTVEMDETLARAVMAMSLGARKPLPTHFARRSQIKTSRFFTALLNSLWVLDME